MNLQIENKPAIFKKLHGEDVQVSHYAGGYPYKDSVGLIHESTALNPIYSYAKGFTKYKIDFSLFMWSTESDISKVTAHLDATAKTLTKKQILPYATTQSRDYEYVGEVYKMGK